MGRATNETRVRVERRASSVECDAWCTLSLRFGVGTGRRSGALVRAPRRSPGATDRVELSSSVDVAVLEHRRTGCLIEARSAASRDTKRPSSSNWHSLASTAFRLRLRANRAPRHPGRFRRWTPTGERRRRTPSSDPNARAQCDGGRWPRNRSTAADRNGKSVPIGGLPHSPPTACPGRRPRSWDLSSTCSRRGAWVEGGVRARPGTPPGA